MADTAFDAPGQQTAFDAPQQRSAFADVDESSQRQGQIQAQFDQSRSRRNYIAAIQKGASGQRGSIRAGVNGPED
jgi:hypothetical protein